ncbi:MAG: cysteine desulfurase [Muribaculaceae bacterium]|nr:cysteine desulfurase [Muribaculaceae bacterium]
MLDIAKIRSEFPSLDRLVNGKPLIYLDNTATSQTPDRVIEAVREMYVDHKANVHRGVHTLSQEATEMQERTRRHLAKYLNAGSEKEIIFTRGTTEALNLVASSLGKIIPEDSEIILTVMEHHSNIVPWQLLQASNPGMKIRVVNINDRGELDLDQYRSLFNEKTRIAAFCHVSNVLGTINPVKEMTRIAHEHGAIAVIDGAQASPHLHIDVKDLDCDFYAFSAHKMYGPSGIGVLYGKEKLLERMPPYQGGGEMISHVSFEGTTFADLPFKFEAGTPDFVGIAAFDEALNFLESTGLDAIEAHEEKLLRLATDGLRDVAPGVRIFGEASHKSAVLSFLVGDEHPYDFGMLLDGLGVAVRTGHHCAQPLMERLGIPGTVRASFAVYNTEEEVGQFLKAVERVASMLG